MRLSTARRKLYIESTLLYDKTCVCNKGVQQEYCRQTRVQAHSTGETALLEQNAARTKVRLT